MVDLPKAPVRRLMKNEGANLVSNDAVLELIDLIEKYAVKITKNALELMRHSNRKTLKKEDVKSAANL